MSEEQEREDYFEHERQRYEHEREKEGAEAMTLPSGPDAPKRIQRKRTKGWRMPKGAVYVGRPTRWGNPFEVGGDVTRDEAIELFVIDLACYFGWVEREVAQAFCPMPAPSTEFREWLKPLRGKDLACWCPLDQPCHADVLLELANS